MRMVTSTVMFSPRKRYSQPLNRCYSAQEHTTLHSGKTAFTWQPAEISIEALLSTFIIAAGLVLHASLLRPVQWNIWAGKLELEGHFAFTAGNLASGNIRSSNNSACQLEIRPSFVNIRKHRSDFVLWARSSLE